jgi:two-component system response regulator RstA
MRTSRATWSDVEIPRILLVEDDLELADLVRARLEREGFSVTHEPDGARAAERIVDEPPDLVLLDVMLPSLDGFGVCRAVRPTYAGPILMLTALDDDIDQVLGLELGADDYVVKPVRPRVLVARVRALLRRHTPAKPTELRRVESGAIVIDHARREVLRDGAPVVLTTTEFDLLWLLASRAGEVVDREEIYRVVYGTEYDGMHRSADVYVSKLRAKLGDDPRSPSLLKTVRGTGYLFVPES